MAFEFLIFVSQIGKEVLIAMQRPRLEGFKEQSQNEIYVMEKPRKPCFPAHLFIVNNPVRSSLDLYQAGTRL